MKFVVGSLFSKKKKSSSSSSPRSISKNDPPSFGSPTSSSSSLSSVEFSSSTPKSVLPLCVSDVFNVFDRDRDGKISKDELESVLRRLGFGPLTDEEVVSMVAEIDRDGDGCISLEELRSIGTDALVDLGGGGGGGSEEEMRDVFRVFDVDGDGKISAEELMGVFVALGDEECGIEECRRMIKGVDSDGDGFVCFQDFVRMMMMEGQR